MIGIITVVFPSEKLTPSVDYGFPLETTFMNSPFLKTCYGNQESRHTDILNGKFDCTST